ncbi:complement C1q and tumor necrosis factor-related protein 9-like [Ambystoma mexicanum]|uniref:complement C1q and tumor necrosis factor-related protein 9-like n=1 Tax=Ambystoma mexicanum TaxID=8296 RepID=UPI0037E95D78
MVSMWYTTMFLCCAWGIVTSTTILGLTSSPLFTMDALNSVVTGDPEQASTVPPEPQLLTAETDPSTDGGIQGHSQSSETSRADSSLPHNVADRGVNNITLPKLKPPTIATTQPILLEPFSTTDTGTASTEADGTAHEEGNNDTFTALPEKDRSAPLDDYVDPSLKMLQENGTEGIPCFCSTPGPEGQKGDQGERGDWGQSGLSEKKVFNSIEAPSGTLGPNARQGEKRVQGLIGAKGEQGPPGQKGESGEPCTSCPKGERGDKGVPGNKGSTGPQGFVGETGANGIPGLKGENGMIGNPGRKGSRGPKGDMGHVGETGAKGSKGSLGPPGPSGLKGNPGFQGKVGSPGRSGPPGLPGRKGEKGQRGDCTEQEHIAFSVGLQSQQSFPPPGAPVLFEKVFLNINKGYNTKSGIFTASIEGIYFFSFHLSVSGKPLKVALYHNNKIVVQTLTRHNESYFGQTSGSILIQLDEDDEIYLQVFSASQNGLMADANTDSLFSGMLLFPIPD